MPKKNGGLGVWNLEIWNSITVVKLSWHISTLYESLWVRWVHGVYTKGTNWMLFNPPSTASWSFKKICNIKHKLAVWMNKHQYSVQVIYSSIFDSTPKVSWDRFVRHRPSVPKARFILWLTLLGRLKTRDKLAQMGIIDDDRCPMCNLCPESVEHIFFSVSL